MITITATIIIIIAIIIIRWQAARARSDVARAQEQIQ